MGRSKPRTNKRPPPKPRQPRAASPASTPSGTPPPPPLGSGLTPAHFDAALSLLPPHLPNLDAGDPSYQAALRSWSSATWNQLQHFGHLPYLSPAYVSALAGVACGFADGFLSADGASLPHSLPALLEARVALDSEKAKLIRMQGELKEYREAQKAGAAGGGNARAGPPPPPLSAKGKEVAVVDDDDLAECTCGRNGHTHEYPGSAHSASDDYYYYDTEDEDGCCECCSHDHSYVECDHDGECDCEEYDSHSHTHSHSHDHDHDHHHHEHGHEHHHHHHHHQHEGEVASDPGLEFDYSSRDRGAFEAVVVGPDGQPANLTPEQALALFSDPAAVALRDLPPPGYLNSPEARAILARHHAKSHEVAAAKRQLAMLSMEDRVSEAAAQDTEVREARSRAEVPAHARETAMLLSQSERQRIIQKEIERRQAALAAEVGKQAEAPRSAPSPTAAKPPATPADPPQQQQQQQQQTQQPRKRLADDPERMDEQCRKLFNWVKAVVWSIEQGAILHARKEAALAYERKHGRMPPCPPQRRQ